MPKGDVDDRPIEEIEPKDLKGYTQCHFFAGIGGWPRAFQLAGWDAARPVWSGSCPCQPLSSAGKGLGHEDERHLWPVWYGLIQECRPSVVFGEQVASKLGREWLVGVRSDLEALGYVVGAADLPAGMFAPHKRNRLFWVGVPDSTRLQQGDSTTKTARYGDSAESTGIGITNPTGRVADSEYEGLERYKQYETRQHRKDEGLQFGADDIQCSANFWSNSILIPCADGRYRRVPGKRVADSNQFNDLSLQQKRELQISQDCGSCGQRNVENCNRKFFTAEYHLEIEPHVLTMVDGLRDRMGDSWDESILESLNCFPLSESIPGRIGILKGAGNAIVPSVAAEFIMALYPIISEV